MQNGSPGPPPPVRLWSKLFFYLSSVGGAEDTETHRDSTKDKTGVVHEQSKQTFIPGDVTQELYMNNLNKNLSMEMSHKSCT